MAEEHMLHVTSKNPPVLEVDTEAQAVYVRFNNNKVAKTIERPANSMHLAVDIDSRGNVIGIEAIGLTEFRLKTILAKAKVETPPLDFAQTRYISVGMIPA